MYDVFLCLWEILNYQFPVENFVFSLWNVIEVSIILSILGLALSKIIFFIQEKR